MYYYEVAPTKIVRLGAATFTYQSPVRYEMGTIVAIPVGKQLLSGVIVREVAKPNYTTKVVESVLESPALPLPLVTTALWMADYYATPLATVLQTVLPRGLGKSRRTKTPPPPREIIRNTHDAPLSHDQLAALAAIDAMTPGTALLHGVTGSGKTRVYIEEVRRSLAAKKSAIVLVPEIALTSQLVDEFSLHFPDVLVAHSRMTEAERHTIWRQCLTSEAPLVVIGPRSALFLPLKAVGTIVIDEMHEPSFKQEQSPRYSALRVASILASHHQAKLILGSATPSVAEYYLAERSSRPIISMPMPVHPNHKRPHVTLVDMTKRTHFKKHRLFSDQLLASIEAAIASGNQALVFHNRRGSASTTLCENCGWSATCPRCFIPLVLHADRHQLQCHVCAHSERVPTSCPTCHQTEIIHKGIGTKLIETELKKIFPKVTIARFDGDSDYDVASHYNQLYSGEIQLIVGTQVIAKGLDLPHLRAVGVVQADAGLSLPDFGASERTFQLLAQVVGRVGRSEHETSVVVQSYQPSAPAVALGLEQNYHDFFTTALAERQRGNFPPFSFLLKLICSYKTEASCIKNSKKLAAELRASLPPTVEVLGPTPAFYERQRDSYRWQLTLKSRSRADLLLALSQLPPQHWQFELDPTSLL